MLCLIESSKIFFSIDYLLYIIINNIYCPFRETLGADSIIYSLHIAKQIIKMTHKYKLL